VKDIVHTGWVNKYNVTEAEEEEYLKLRRVWEMWEREEKKDSIDRSFTRPFGSSPKLKITC